MENIKYSIPKILKDGKAHFYILTKGKGKNAEITNYIGGKKVNIIPQCLIKNL